jgi:diguanylate cyclase (GGDEF)-like protein/PAS domain S-box-containing protein
MLGIRAARLLRARYVLALAAIALLVSASFFTMQRLVSEQRRYAQLVNLAGHQSGLVNRIAYFASLMATTTDQDEFAVARSQVGRTVAKLERAHRQLTQGDPDAGVPLITSETLRTIYDDPMVGLDLALSRFLERARSVYETPIEDLSTGSVAYIFLVNYGPHVLEPLLDAAVDEYEQLGLDAIARIERLELFIWLTALGMLLIEATFVFAPLERRIHRIMESLEQTISDLEATRGRLLAAQELAALGDWEWDVRRDEWAWSPQVFRLLGLSPDERAPTMETLIQATHPEDRGQLREMLRRAASTDEPQQLDHRLQRADGDELIVSHQTTSSLGPDGGVRKVSGILQDITERKRSESRIRQLALFDPLTGLANRRVIQESIEDAIRRAQRGEALSAIVALDLDNFKSINDTRGHDVGDRLLASVAGRLKAHVRKIDLAGRLGGDEFVAILNGIGATIEEARQNGLAIAENLREAIAKPHDLTDRDDNYHTTASVGVTVVDGECADTDTPLKQADIALFDAKESGRNRVCLFSEERQAEVVSRADLIESLRRALSGEEFFLDYQLQVGADGRPLGAEALLRWRRPGEAPTYPGEFLSAAEESGLIHGIGAWVLERVCVDLGRLDGLGLPSDFRLSVNVSPRQLVDDSFLARFSDSMRLVGCGAERLTVEVTESSLILDVDRAARMLQHLRNLGVALHIDDFGTGYSSLTSLKHLPADALKLDRSLIDDIAAHASGPAIVRAAIALAKSMGLGVIAEGVETEDQRQFLLSEGCESFQGYLLGRPMPLEELALRVRG